MGILFWTFSRLPAASTSNLPLLQIPFGLPPCFPPLQRPIRRSFSLLLDFLPPPATSTSNPPLFLTPFGLLPAFPPLQHPIHRSFSLLSDFLPPSRRFNVQSAASTHASVVCEYFINYYLTLMSEYFIFLL